MINFLHHIFEVESTALAASNKDTFLFHFLFYFCWINTQLFKDEDKEEDTGPLKSSDEEEKEPVKKEQQNKIETQMVDKSIQAETNAHRGDISPIKGYDPERIGDSNEPSISKNQG